ncbi:MAG: RluA family pseudouridine synthase [Endomicrobium sp.]|jgi:23S rRNA pseudouridine1911/1915/1917 synthase|nr:RluA family pseudouridine synthase [Endomicrobium sp.]
MQKLIYKSKLSKRLDSYLAAIYVNEHSRTYFKKLICDKKILINNKVVNKASEKLKYNDTIFIIKESAKKTFLKTDITKQSKIDFPKIIYEDEDIIVVNKAPNIVVHPSYGHDDNTLIDLLKTKIKNIYLVHRLDKNTSGVIMFAKNHKTQLIMLQQFKKRLIKKIYYTVIKGIISENKAIIKAPIGRSHKNRKIMSVNPTAKKMAITEFEVIKRKTIYTILRIKILTGRTHQIRSHMKYIGHPIIGDKQYGGPCFINGNFYNRQMLHSYILEIQHPRSLTNIKFIAELPTDMQKIFKNINLK